MAISDKQKIKQLQKKVNDLKAEIDYLKSPLYLFEVIESIKGTYSVLLNPPLRDFPTTSNQKACTYKITPAQIVCIKSEGKIKWIYFESPQISVSGVRFVSDKLSYYGSLDEFCKDYDSAQVHLCVISRSVAVNPAFYFLDSDKVRLMGDNNPHGVCDNLSISPQFVQRFSERKATIDSIISFQKIRFEGK